MSKLLYIYKNGHEGTSIGEAYLKDDGTPLLYADGNPILFSDGSPVRAVVKQYEYVDQFMGERYVMMTIASPLPIDWEKGDWCEVNGEKMTLRYIPTGKKQARKKAMLGSFKSDGAYAEAFVYENVKFGSCVSELALRDFLDYDFSNTAQTYTGLGSFSFYVESLWDFANKIQANLDVAFGEGEWIIEVKKGSTEYESQNTWRKQVVSISRDTSILAAVAMFNSTFNQNYVIEEKPEGYEYIADSTGTKKILTKRTNVITIGGDTMVMSRCLYYGKGNGLRNLSIHTESNAMAITRLRAYGSTRNIPYRYYNRKYKERKVDGTPIYPQFWSEGENAGTYMLESLFFPNLMLPVEFWSLIGENKNILDVHIDSLTKNYQRAGILEYDAATKKYVTKKGILDDNPDDINEGQYVFDTDDNEYDEVYPTLEGLTIDNSWIGRKYYLQGYRTSQNSTTKYTVRDIEHKILRENVIRFVEYAKSHVYGVDGYSFYEDLDYSYNNKKYYREEFLEKGWDLPFYSRVRGCDTNWMTKAFEMSGDLWWSWDIDYKQGIPGTDMQTGNAVYDALEVEFDKLIDYIADNKQILKVEGGRLVPGMFTTGTLKENGVVERSKIVEFYVLSAFSGLKKMHKAMIQFTIDCGVRIDNASMIAKKYIPDTYVNPPIEPEKAGNYKDYWFEEYVEMTGKYDSSLISKIIANTYNSSGRLDKVVSDSVITHTMTTENPDGELISHSGIYDNHTDGANGMSTNGKIIETTWQIKIPQIGFDITDFIADEAKLCMKTGMCAGREFKIAACIPVDTEDYSKGWLLTIDTSSGRDDSLNMIFPNENYEIRKGDEYVLTGINMPDVYVEAAEEKLVRQAMKYMSKVDDVSKSYEVELDNKWMYEHPEYVAELKTGKKFLFSDFDKDDVQTGKGDLGLGVALSTIKQVNIKYGNAIIPQYQIALDSNTKAVTINSIVSEEVKGQQVDFSALLARSIQGLNDTLFHLDREKQRVLQYTYFDEGAEIGKLEVKKGLKVGGDAGKTASNVSLDNISSITVKNGVIVSIKDKEGNEIKS